MSKRGAPIHFPPALPVTVKKETAHSIAVANRKAEVLQKKNESLEAELNACKKRLDEADEMKKQAVQDARAESSTLKRFVQQLTVENEELKRRGLHSQSSGSHPQLQLQSQQQKMKQLQEQLSQAHFAKKEVEAKLHTENQSRAQLITKMSKVNEANQSLTRELQQLKQKCAMDADPKKVHELNLELQRRIEYLCHENDILKNENDRSTKNDKLERALDESNLDYDSLNEEKNRLAIELKMTQEKEEKLRTELEKAEWMHKLMKDQLDFCKKNSEMWQEQSRVLSDHLRRTGGTMGLVQQSCFVPSPFMQQSPPIPGCVSYPTLPTHLGNSRTSSTAVSEVIVLEEDSHAKRLKRENSY